jgi:glutaminase
VVDFKRVHLADSAACKLILRLAHSMRERDTDAALEWCEDQLLAEILQRDSERPKFSLSKLDVFQGLSAEEYSLLETIVRPLLFNRER